MASEKITAILDSIKELSILELKELIDTYCEEFGVSAVAAAAPAAGGAAPAAEEKTEFDVVLVEAGGRKGRAEVIFLPVWHCKPPTWFLPRWGLFCISFYNER